MAQLHEKHAGVAAVGAGVLGALPAQLPQDGHRVDRVSLLEQSAGGRSDVPVLRNGQVLVDERCEQRRGVLLGGAQQAAKDGGFGQQLPQVRPVRVAPAGGSVGADQLEDGTGGGLSGCSASADYTRRLVGGPFLSG